MTSDGRTVVASSFNADNLGEPGPLLAWSLADGSVKTLTARVNFNGGGWLRAGCSSRRRRRAA